MLVIWAGTPRSPKLAKSDLMKVPARVVAPIECQQSNKKKEKGTTYPKSLKGCSDDEGKGRPWRDEASLYQRRVRESTATRGLGSRRRTILHARHREIIIRHYLAWGSVGNKAESSRRTGVGLCTRVRTALQETTYNSKDPHSRKPVSKELV
jgi:hypothetical protein